MSLDEFMKNPFTAGINELRRSSGWFMTLGIALTFLGFVCVVRNMAATLATVFVFGWLLLFAGIVALVHAFQVRDWSGFFLYFLTAVLRGFTGYLLIRYPTAGAMTLTMILASFFIVGGIFRTVGSATLKFPRWGWAVFSGVLSVILGVMLLVQGASSIWYIGFAIGLDMIFDGMSLIALATALRALPKLFKTKAA